MERLQRVALEIHVALLAKAVERPFALQARLHRAAYILIELHDDVRIVAIERHLDRSLVLADREGNLERIAANLLHWDDASRTGQADRGMHNIRVIVEAVVPP